MRRLNMNVVVALFLLVCVHTVIAREDEKKPEKLYASSTSLSLLFISGNQKEFTLGFETEQNFNFDKNLIQIRGSLIHTDNHENDNINILTSRLDYKRVLDSRLFLLGNGRYERNKSSGYNHRLTLSGGIGYTLIKAKKVALSADSVIGWSHENNIVRASQMNFLNSFFSLIVSSDFSWKISENSEVKNQNELFINLEKGSDYRFSTILSLSASISRSFALKITYRLKHCHLPVPGFKSNDHYIMSSLVVNL